MRLFTVEEASKILRVSKKTVYRWLKSGVLPYCKLGKSIRIKEEDLEALIEQSYVTVDVRGIVEDAIKKVLCNY